MSNKSKFCLVKKKYFNNDLTTRLWSMVDQKKKKDHEVVNTSFHSNT